MKYKYAVFDWDGTLADTYPQIVAAYNYTFSQMGLPVMEAEELKKITSTVQNKDILGYIFADRKDEATEHYYDYIRRFHTRDIQANNGAKELLDFGRSAGIKMFLITNKRRMFIDEELKALAMEKYFAKVVAAGEYAEDKPHPIACRALFDGLVPPAEQIVVVGDGMADVATAASLGGADCIIYDPTGRHKADIGTYKFDDLSKIKDFLGGQIGK